MAKKNGKSFLNIKVVVVLACLIIGFVLGMLVEKQKEAKEIVALQNSNTEKDSEILTVIKNEATLVHSYDEQYSFYTAGVYSPLFAGKTMQTVEYLYKRTSYKKISITLSSSTPNVQYLVNIWQMKKNSFQQTVDNGTNIFGVLPDYDLYGLTERSSIPVVSLDVVESNWVNNGKNNGRGIFLHEKNFNNRFANLGIEFSLSTSPNGKTYFVQIKPALISYVGDANFSGLNLNELTVIANSMSSTVYK